MSDTRTPTLDAIAATGNRNAKFHRTGPNKITCADGFTISVVAGMGTYCTPRPEFGEASADYPGPYAAVEVGFPSEQPEPWDEWAKYVDDATAPTDTIYGFTPVDLVRDLLIAHGGEVSAS